MTTIQRRSSAWTASAAIACAALITTAAATAQAAPMDSAGTSPTPSGSARAAGIHAGGDAYMGWSQDAPTKDAPTKAAPTKAAPTKAAPTTDASTRTQAAAQAATAQTSGIDVSKWQGNVDWASWWSQGKKFAYVKATEGTTYQNTYFAQQYNGSYNVGMIRGAYHFALPGSSTGTAQADWFVNHGGGWSGDGKTLPGVLDIEYNPYGATCYGLTQASMRSWIAAFTSRYKARTGRDAVIYSTTSWWTTCTGNTSQFSASNPLWIARYNTTPGTLPAGWAYYTFWQYSDSPVDQDYFNGDLTRLKALALG